MRRRQGHGRPVGTLTAAYRFSQFEERQPELGDVTFQVEHAGGEPRVLKRGYLLVGIEETESRSRPYRLIFERLDYGDAWERVRRGAPWWCWFNSPS